ncbi:MAG TPA: SAM-dependent methyltransferase [Pyrinomonadaceae bacterium]|jgi:SAM-dependent methyltransferase|nr:SAM-dependent methyltransferase [Pyrinomonadaceae bacterium]
MAEPNQEQFIAALEESIEAGGFVKLTLSKRRGGDSDLKNLYVRPVALKKGARLSFSYRYKTRDEVKNHTVAEAVRLIRKLLGAEFLSGHLFTTVRDLQIEFNRKGESRLVRRTPTFNEPTTNEHDRRKRRDIQTAGNVYLQALGVTDRRGAVRPAMGDKLRQINRFVETVGGLFDSSPLAGREEISIVDMGSGKGYLTFAVYDYFNHARGLRAVVRGVESRPELVELCNATARRAGFDRLNFQAGLIQDYELPATDILIALHACDTATDDALFKALKADAAIIITAPCCHKELRPQMKPPAPLRGVLRHGILLEREAESVTDSLRALLLEGAGYKVKVFEFISTEHTHKNTLIAAVKLEGRVDTEEALSEYRALKEFYQIREQRLEQLLCAV